MMFGIGQVVDVLAAASWAHHLLSWSSLIDNRWCQYWHGHESSGQLLHMGRHGERDRRCLLRCCWVLKYHRHGTME